MQDNQSRKYTDIFTFIGYVIGFLCFVGYGIDRIIDLKENK